MQVHRLVAIIGGTLFLGAFLPLIYCFIWNKAYQARGVLRVISMLGFGLLGVANLQNGDKGQGITMTVIGFTVVLAYIYIWLRPRQHKRGNYDNDAT